MNTPHFDLGDAADAAMRVFWRKGYTATSVQDLVDATGLSRSSLYNTFEGKHGLFQFALKRYHGQTARNVAMLEQPGSARERVRELMLDIVTDELAGADTCGCLIANTSLELRGQDREVVNLLEGHFGALETALTALMLRGQQQGELRAGASPQALARFVVATIQGLRVMGRGSADSDQAQRLHDVVDIALGAL